VKTMNDRASVMTALNSADRAVTYFPQGGRADHQSPLLRHRASWPSRMTRRFERDGSALRARETRGGPSGMVRRARFGGRTSRRPAPIGGFSAPARASWSMGIEPCPGAFSSPWWIPAADGGFLVSSRGRMTGLPPEFYTLKTPQWLALNAPPGSRSNYSIDHRTSNAYLT
jgi:hypothetical protein